MKSIKGGRGSSIIGAIGLFGIAAVAAVALGEFNKQDSFGFGGGNVSKVPTVFLVVFILIAVCCGVYELYNAIAKNRPSVMDITDGKEEPDPLNEYFHGKYDMESTKSPAAQGSRFCPNCGKPVEADANFCSRCGKELKK